MMAIVFFDIDDTLLTTTSASRHALGQAFIEVFGVVPVADGMVMAGRTDAGIARELFEKTGIDFNIANLQRLYDAYATHLRTQLPARESRLLPGVVNLLEILSTSRSMNMGIITGNSERGARLKLEHLGISNFFKFGGFGDHHHDRDDVAKAALDGAASLLGDRVRSFPIFVVGDTPHDITCARAIGGKSVAVATGMYDKQMLAKYQPDVLLSDLTEAHAIFRPFL